MTFSPASLRQTRPSLTDAKATKIRSASMPAALHQGKSSNIGTRFCIFDWRSPYLATVQNTGLALDLVLSRK
ncbi:hypothetical protein ACP4OV_003114 [Aristida adscensionis]